MATVQAGLSILLDEAARLAGQRVPGARRSGLARFVDTLDEALAPAAAFAAAWEAAGLEGGPERLSDPTPADLPFVAWCNGWGLVQTRGADGVWRGTSPGAGAWSLEALGEAVCVSLPGRPGTAGLANPDAMGLVGKALWKRKGVFLDAVLATALVNLLTLATSLYAMQVYDRVIPNQGFQTLWVLSVGVAIAIGLEFMLKQVRASAVDRTCNAIDSELSEWFFNRMLGIRMDARPPSVGTLASQVKGFELVRGVLASTSLFVLTDVPFALFFVVIIAMVGGWLAVIPLAALPVALLTGLMFQGAIERQTRLNLAASNRKVGVLVEAVDGAESLKANGGEWRLQGRWNRLVEETGTAEQAIRNHSSRSQNLTAAFQQLTYICLVALGSYLVTESHLTMGGLIACSIIGGRAMMPVVQLPGVMVQWAHARMAIEGLQQVIGFPNEAEEAHRQIAPQLVAGSVRIERARYAYGTGRPTVLEVGQLEIRPGERIGLLGTIGSGKSTLLKLASGLYRPAEGKVFLGGVDVAMLTPAVVRETVGYLPQDARLFSGTMRENLVMGLADPGDEAILAAATRTGLIDLVLGQPRGLALEISEGGRGVSGGQKQLIAITRMVLARPRIWLLDEPVGAMDSVSEGGIITLLRELSSEGATVVVATHKTAMLPLLDRLVVLQAGRVLLDGPRDAVLAKLAGRAPPATATAFAGVAA